MSRYELPPARLGRWLARWAAAQEPVARTTYAADTVTFDGAREHLVCTPPFPPLAAAGYDGFAPQPLLDHVGRRRRVGVLLVRLGGYAAGVFDGDELVDSKVGARLVHGRHRKGGSSQARFQRRRGEQARAALQDAADVAARILLPAADTLDAVVLGGDRGALRTLAADPRLRELLQRAEPRVLDVPEPRLAVLRAAPERFRATVAQVW